MNKLTIYINPACSNCQRALALLDEQNISATTIEYLTSPLSKSELAHIIDLGVAATDLIRTKEEAWQQLGIDIDTATQEELIDIVAKTPSVMQRPIVVTDEVAIIARPPEKILDIL